MPNIKRLLIANRGEIAVRIIRTCERLGIETVLAASVVDLDSMAARLANQTVCIGPGPSSQSYLCVDNIIRAAQQSGADALHPGYGFLSENQQLARACRLAGIGFVGPTPEHLEAIGDKLKARTHAVAAGLPIVPGGPADSPEAIHQQIAACGFPMLIKAVGGGGGRGMKVVEHEEDLPAALDIAIGEAQSAFGDPRVYIERFVRSGRHVEVQILSDGHHTIHLGTRDCSVQRRYQKLLEEAPAPALTDSLRAEMHTAAVNFAKHLGYVGAGTVELLVDCERQTFYFLEMNARIQVEHPVTEAISGIDLIAEQIAIAEGRTLRLSQDDIQLQGHAIECRINAEDWHNNFQPSPGIVSASWFPVSEYLRVDTHIQPGASVPPFYDSMVAKVIAWGEDREAARLRLSRALQNCRIEGITTNIPMHTTLLEDPGFVDAGSDTAYFSQFLSRKAQEVSNVVND